MGALPADSPTTQSSEGGPTGAPWLENGVPSSVPHPLVSAVLWEEGPTQLPAYEAEALPTTRGGPDTC